MCEAINENGWDAWSPEDRARINELANLAVAEHMAHEAAIEAGALAGEATIQWKHAVEVFQTASTALAKAEREASAELRHEARNLAAIKATRIALQGGGR